MKKQPEDLAAPRVLLTEAGEQQWLNEMLDEATAQQEKKCAAVKRPAAVRRSRPSQPTQK